MVAETISVGFQAVAKPRESSEGLTPTSPANERQESWRSCRAASSAAYSAAVLIVVLAMTFQYLTSATLSRPRRRVC